MSNFLSYLKTTTFRKNIIAAFVLLAILFCGLYFGLGHYTKHDEAIPVPKVEGMLINQAIVALRNAKLEYKLDSVYQMDAKPGLVIDQDPDAGFRVKSERTVYLTVISNTAPHVEFPNIVDKTLIEASALLKSYGFRIGDMIYVSDIAKDVVLSAKVGEQTWVAGAVVPKGSTIDLVLGNGRGSGEISVPNVLGLTLLEAKFALQGVGLKFGTIQHQGNIRDSTAARVIFQSPTSSDVVGLGTPINLSLAEEGN